MNQRYDDNGAEKFMKLIKEYWPLVTSIIFFIATIVYMKTTIQAHEKALIDNTVYHGTNSIEHIEMRERIKRVETIVDLLPEMRTDIKDLLRHSKKSKED